MLTKKHIFLQTIIKSELYIVYVWERTIDIGYFRISFIRYFFGRGMGCYINEMICLNQLFEFIRKQLNHRE